MGTPAAEDAGPPAGPADVSASGEARATGAAQLPSAARLALLGALFVLVPGIGLFLVLFAVGVATPIAGIVGLFTMVAGMGAFPAYLRRLPTGPPA